MNAPLTREQTKRYSMGEYSVPALYHLLHCRRVLMLQGPMGRFFNRLAAWLTQHGVEVRKINFNAGDWLFHRHLNATEYRGTLAEFPAFLEEYIRANGIDGIVCFGDCRHYHLAAAKVATVLERQFFVFEEGYVRPDYLTLERGGVNTHSLLPRNTEFYRSLPDVDVPAPRPALPSFWRMGGSAMLYYGVGRLLRWRYPFYEHHKIFSVRYEARNWIRSYVRKHVNRRRDKPVFDMLLREHDDKYFAVALQVYNDSQITKHSAYADVREFITEVVASFAEHGHPDHHLVFKHHPMDRGQRDYRRLLNRLAAQYRLNGRIHYLHDVHLPTLLRHSRGAVMINSSVGLSALYHDKPLMVMGRALYDLPGLTFQGSLAQFWKAKTRSDRALWRRFRSYLVTQTQLNGAFYGNDFFELMPGLHAAPKAELATPLVSTPISRASSGKSVRVRKPDLRKQPVVQDGEMELVANS